MNVRLYVNPISDMRTVSAFVKRCTAFGRFTEEGTTIVHNNRVVPGRAIVVIDGGLSLPYGQADYEATQADPEDEVRHP